MSWSMTTSVNPSGFGFFAVQAWRKGTVTYAVDPDPTDNQAPEIIAINPTQVQDVTFFRDVPAQIDTLEFSDPFGDATATLRFPQCTGFDALGSGDTWWLSEYVNVDVLWVPCSESSAGGERLVQHPITQMNTLYAHESQAVPVWEGFIISVEPGADGVAVQCLGALRQLDNYYARPLNPLQPKFVESYIARYFDPRRRGIWTLPLKIEWPTGWETVYDEAKKKEYDAIGPRYVPSEKTIDVATGLPPKWTGYITRNSGSWQPILTGYVNEQLSILYAKPAETEGANPLLSKGDQWTITNTPGRQPVMRVRASDKEPTLVAYYGQPGVEARLSRDGTQAYNVVFGKGSGPSSESVFENRWYLRGSAWTVWRPLHAKKFTWRGEEGAPYYPNGFPIRDLYDGYDASNERVNGIVVREKYVGNFPDGLVQGDAQQIAENWVEKDSDPGWTGEITLTVDLRDMSGAPKSKWHIRDGDVIVLYGFQGTGNSVVKGVNKFHVTRVTLSPMNGTVTLQVDTKFRDQLTVEEAMQRGKDTLSPIKSLIVNRASMKIEDSLVPWDAFGGSGLIPRYSKDFAYTDLAFPNLGDTGPAATAGQVGTRTNGYRPRDIFKPAYLPGGNGRPVQGDDYVRLPDKTAKTAWLRSTASNSAPFYVPVHAGAGNKSLRWATFPVLLSQAGTIALTEICAYDVDGEPAPVEFHVSVYLQNYVFISDMPKNMDPANGKTNENAALWPGSFETLDPETNLPWALQGGGAQSFHMPAATLKIGWGTYDRPAGYSPGAKTSDTATPTGYLIDGAPWTFDFVNVPGGLSASGLNAGQKPPNASNVTATVAIYAQIPDVVADKGKYDWVYFRGRFCRDIPTA